MRDGVEVHDAPAGGRPERAHTAVAPVKRRFMRAERLHDRRRQIVLAVLTSRIAARQKKESRRLVDDDASCVLDPARPRPLVDRYLEAYERGHLSGEPRRVLLTAPALGKPVSRGGISTLHHDL